MALPEGTRLGSYEVVAPLGAGGMGEVYRARDTKLGRDVAVKVLPDTLAADPERIARFEREAKVLASLNHPNVAQIYGLERQEGQEGRDGASTAFIVMELVEGETLAERIDRSVGRVLSDPPAMPGPKGPGLPINEALAIALQIAEGLEAAHEKGIVHRDLKPANVKITPDEKVKVLDFGLAKAMEAERSPSNLTHSPTLSLMATQAGMILGTAAYMSPEQAKGLPADHRSDVFSFGVVLYEMLTGRQPFRGETAPDILASVLARDPELNVLPANLHPRLLDLVRRCLEKTPKRRWQAIGDVRAELETIAANPHAAPASPAPPAAARPMWRRALLPAATAIVASAITGAAVWNLRPPGAGPVPVTRFTFALSEGQVFSGTRTQLITISPDGAQIVYVANNRLFLRAMSDPEARPIPGTESMGATPTPVFSPDGRSIAYWASDATVKRIAVSGGAAVTICQAESPWGMSWGTDGILFAQGGKGIMRVSPNGGKPELVVSTKADELAYGPQMLPGGTSVLFTLANSRGGGTDRWDKAQVVVQSIRSGERKTLVDGGSDARYLSTGHIVYALVGTVFAIPFDPARLEVSGGPAPIVEGVRRSVNSVAGTAQFSVSNTGSLIYVPGPASNSAGQQDVALFDRKGAAESLKLSPGSYEYPRVSPDGKRIAFGTSDGKEAIVWIYDLAGASAMRRLTFGGNNRFPIWSADGQHVAFQSDREGDLGVFWQRADGTGAAERLTKPEPKTAHTPEAWSPKGESLLFSVTAGADVTLWALTLKDKKATPFGAVHSTAGPTTAAFSPDSRWVAYYSNDSGPIMVYVQPFPATGAKYQISKEPGAHHPVWAPDGKELLYIPTVGNLASVTVATQPTLTFSNPVLVPRGFSVSATGAPRNYDVAPDGRIVGVLDSGLTQSGALVTPQIQVVLNWFEELKARVPTK
ncbi:MAG: serine/threonine-protein kinase [Acidobacteria bacterium]|nr:serine/threonine-protein kinase [Acidobacteriota bacterium]